DVKRSFGRRVPKQELGNQGSTKSRDTDSQSVRFLSSFRAHGLRIRATDGRITNPCYLARYGSRSVWCPIIFHWPFSLRKMLVARMETFCGLPSTMFSPTS